MPEGLERPAGVGGRRAPRWWAGVLAWGLWVGTAWSIGCCVRLVCRRRHVDRVGRSQGGGGGERGDRRGGPGRPSTPAPGGLAAARPGRPSEPATTAGDCASPSGSLTTRSGCGCLGRPRSTSPGPANADSMPASNSVTSPGLAAPTCSSPARPERGSWTTTAPSTHSSSAPRSRSHQRWRPISWRQYRLPSPSDVPITSPIRLGPNWRNAAQRSVQSSVDNCFRDQAVTRRSAGRPAAQCGCGCGESERLRVCGRPLRNRRWSRARTSRGRRTIEECLADRTG